MNGPALAALLTPPGRGAIATIRVSVEWATWQPLDVAPLPGRQPPTSERSARRSDRLRPLGRGARRGCRCLCRRSPFARDSLSRRPGRRSDESCEISKAPAAASSAGRSRSAPPNHRFVPNSSGNCAERPRCKPPRFSGSRRTACFESSLQALVSSAPADLSAAAAQIRDWLTWAEFGLHLTQPWRVVLAGRPNVGKSSLINAILGYTRSVVFDQPGTTRDVVSAPTAIDGWPIELSDTAGLRESADPIESAGVERARATLGAADLAIVLVDISQPASQSDRAIIAEHPRALVVAHKCDLAPTRGRIDGRRMSPLGGFASHRKPVKASRPWWRPSPGDSFRAFRPPTFSFQSLSGKSLSCVAAWMPRIGLTRTVCCRP